MNARKFIKLGINRNSKSELTNLKEAMGGDKKILIR